MPPSAPESIVSVSIIEDDPVIRVSWERIVNQMSGYRCLSNFGTAEQAVQELPKNPPDIVLMDIRLPGMSGIECTRELKRLLPELEIVMLTMFAEKDPLFDALRAGASGYLLKRTTPAALKKALDQTMSGGAPMSPEMSRKIVQFFQDETPEPSKATQALEGLSDREAETLRLLSEGCQYKEIAHRLGLSMDTIRTYIRRIYQKLNVHSRTEAVIKYLGKGK